MKEKMKTIEDIVRENASMSCYDIVVLCKKNKIQTSESSVRRMKRKLGIQASTVVSRELQANGLDGENWDAVWLKNDVTSILVKNKKDIISYEEIREELISEMKKYSPKYPVIKRKKITDGHLLIIDPADVHIGKLALMDETNNEYNVEIAKKRCMDGVIGIIEKSKGFPIEKIVLVVGNDILHTDNPSGTTSKGTKQDTSTQWWKMFLEAKDLYVKIMELLVTIADVHVVFCPSNHDLQSGWALADSLSSWFHLNSHVTFDTRIIHRKYMTYGSNMLGFTHGDVGKDGDIKDLMADEQPKMWGATKFRYVFLHDKHHYKKLSYRSGKDHIGVTLEWLRSPSATDSWHYKEGYVAPKAIEGFIHSRNNGLVAKFTHYF